MEMNDVIVPLTEDPSSLLEHKVHMTVTRFLLWI